VEKKFEMSRLCVGEGVWASCGLCSPITFKVVTLAMSIFSFGQKKSEILAEMSNRLDLKIFTEIMAELKKTYRVNFSMLLGNCCSGIEIAQPLIMLNFSSF